MFNTAMYHIKPRLSLACAFTLTVVCTCIPVRSEALTGDVKAACEALLCLSAGTRPTECIKPLKRYFSIWNRKPYKRIRARLNFLNLCPVSGQTPEMQSLTSALASGAGACSVDKLNEQRFQYHNHWRFEGNSGMSWAVSDHMSNHCTAIYGHSLTDYRDSSMPVYVGERMRRGYWVEAADYDAELKKYKREWPDSRRW